MRELVDATTETLETRAAARARAPRLDREAIGRVLASGKRLLVQGAMGIHASDGLAGKWRRRAAPGWWAWARSRRW